MKHFLAGLTVQNKKLDPKFSGLNIQQVIAVLKTEDGMKIAEIYDTAFPDINSAHVNLFLAAPDLLISAIALDMLIKTLTESVFTGLQDEPGFFKIMSHLKILKTENDRTLAKVAGIL